MVHLVAQFDSVVCGLEEEHQIRQYAVFQVADQIARPLTMAQESVKNLMRLIKGSIAQSEENGIEFPQGVERPHPFSGLCCGH